MVIMTPLFFGGCLFIFCNSHPFVMDLRAYTAVRPTDLAPCLHCRLAAPRQLFFSGTVKGESAMSSLEDIGSPVDFEFVVRNKWFCVCVQGRSSASTVIVTRGRAHFASCLRLRTQVRPCRHSARPSSMSCGPMSCPMANGFCIRPA